MRGPTILLALLGIAVAGASAAAAPSPATPGALPTGAGQRLALGQSHTCVIVTGGAVRCWGNGEVGQLGTGSTEAIGDDEMPTAIPPVDLGPGRGARAITAGDFHSCAILRAPDPAQEGAVRCWGWNRFGQLGYASTADLGDDEPVAALGPVDLGPGRTATALAAGANFTCALLDDGTVRCWGGNSSGQLGLGSTRVVGDDETPGALPPVDLGAGRTAVAIAAGGFHACALLDDAGVRCWGGNGTGELGRGNVANIGDDETPGSVPPIALARDRRVVEVSAGFAHTCAVLDSGALRCWGDGVRGATGLGFDATIGDNELPASVAPVQLGAGRTAAGVAAGQFHTCARLDDGAVRCWGFNSRGQLGYGVRIRVGDAATPDLVTPLDLGGVRAVEVAAGGYHSCARLENATLRCWGANNFGQLGLGGAVDLGERGNLGDDEVPVSAAPVRLSSG